MADPLRVLIVDDEVDLADSTSIMLNRRGYRSSAVYSPLVALELFEKDPYAWDFLIIDQSMPEMDGLTLIRRLKESRPDTKVILCTGFSKVATEETARAAGALLFLNKPVNIEDLLQAMATL